MNRMHVSRFFAKSQLDLANQNWLRIKLNSAIPLQSQILDLDS